MAGRLFLVSVLLTVFVDLAWFWFTVFIGINLLQSAFTNGCPMIWLLKKWRENNFPKKGGVQLDDKLSFWGRLVARASFLRWSSRVLSTRKIFFAGGLTFIFFCSKFSQSLSLKNVFRVVVQEMVGAVMSFPSFSNQKLIHLRNLSFGGPQNDFC